MACAIAGKTVNPFNARFYLPLAKPNHLWITLEYLTGSQEVVGSSPIFSNAVLFLGTAYYIRKMEKEIEGIRRRGKLFSTFARETDDESEKVLASEIVKSLSNLDKLPKTIRDFNKDKFKLDIQNTLCQ